MRELKAEAFLRVSRAHDRMMKNTMQKKTIANEMRTGKCKLSKAQTDQS